MSAPDHDRLLSLARAEQDVAKDGFREAIWAQGAAAVLAAIALFLTGASALVLAGVALLAQLGAWAIRRRAMGQHRLAEEARRRALLIWSLGETRETLDVAEIERRFSRKALEQAKKLDSSSYWTSSVPEGAARLCAGLQESVFFSKHLYEKAAGRVLWRTGLFGVVAIAVVVVALVVISGDAEVDVARVAAVLIGLWISTDALGRALSWRDAGERARDLDRRLESPARQELEPLMAAVADYAVVTASAAPIPDAVYAAEASHLEKLWEQRGSSASSS